MSEPAAKDAKRSLILLVEDDSFLRDIFTRKVRASFDVISTDNKNDALALAKEKHPDVILLDLNLPEGSGFDILHDIRENSQLRDTLILILTNSVLSEDHILSNELHADDFLTKANFSIDEIIERMESHLRERRIARSF